MVHLPRFTCIGNGAVALGSLLMCKLVGGKDGSKGTVLRGVGGGWAGFVGQDLVAS
jgi:hypothetical protein